MRTKLRLLAVLFVFVFTVISSNSISFAADWEMQLTDLPDINCIRGTTDDEIFAVGNIFAYTTNGLWTTRNLPSSKSVASIFITDSNQVFLSGEDFFFGEYFRDTDSFIFNYDYTHESGYINSLWGTDEDHIYGCTSLGKVFILSLEANATGGIEIDAVDTGLNADSVLYSLDGTSLSNIYVVGSKEYAAVYNGSTWTNISKGGGFETFKNCQVGPDGVLYVSTLTNPGTLYKYDGNWNSLTVPSGIGEINSLWISDDGYIFIGESRGNIYKANISDFNWQLMSKDSDAYNISAIWGYDSTYAYAGSQFVGHTYPGKIFKYGEGSGPVSNATFVVPYIEPASDISNPNTAIKITNMSDNDVTNGTCTLNDVLGYTVELELNSTVINSLSSKRTALIWGYGLYDLATSINGNFTAPFSAVFNFENVSKDEIFPYAQYRTDDGQFIIPTYKNDKTISDTTCTFVTPFIDVTMDEGSFIAFANYSNSTASVNATAYTDQGVEYSTNLNSLNATSLNFIPFSSVFNGTGFDYGSLKIVVTGEVGDIYGCVVQKRGGADIGYRAVPLYKNITTTNSIYNYFQ